MVDDPVRGRVLLLAPEVEPVLVHSGAEWMPSFIELLQSKLTAINDPALQNMMATGLIGALTALFTAYLDGRLTASREQFIDYCVDLLLTRAASYPPATRPASPGTSPDQQLVRTRSAAASACWLGELLLVVRAGRAALRAADRVARHTGSREGVVAVQVRAAPGRRRWCRWSRGSWRYAIR